MQSANIQPRISSEAVSLKGLVAVVIKRLLIVEDDPGLQSQMRWCFSGDLEVSLASDRETALACLRRRMRKVP